MKLVFTRYGCESYLYNFIQDAYAYSIVIKLCSTYIKHIGFKCLKCNDSFKAVFIMQLHFWVEAFVLQTLKPPMQKIFSKYAGILVQTA